MDGVLLLDKPAGPTSHDCVDAVRRASGVRRVGHAGTLDPAATGLLVVLVGSAAGEASRFSGLDKSYEAAVRLGSRTDTDDAEGKVLEERPVPSLTEEAVRAALRALSGERLQRPPAHSAVKVKGKPAYWYARKGKPVELAPRLVRIPRLEMTALREREIDLTVDCSSGTYIRSLAAELGAALGTAAHLSRLRRTRVGELRVEDAVPLSDLSGISRDELRGLLRPIKS